MLGSAAAATASPATPPGPAGSKQPAELAGPVRTTSTLDRTLQRAGERLLRAADPMEGGIVAVDPKSGRILTYAARSRSGRPAQVLGEAKLPAASLFKIVTTAALLETSAVSPRDQICISGGMHGIDRGHLEPARGPKAECGPFAYALGHSKNAVFAQLATRWLSRNDLLTTAERIGFNARLPLLDHVRPVELGRLSVPYDDLSFARTAAGFQDSSLSPVGAAYLATLVARGGEPIDLRLRDHELVSDPQAAADKASKPRPERAFSKRTADRLTRMLEVTIETGTCRAAFSSPDGKRYLKGIKVAGKTGTLRAGRGEQGETNTSMTSWFVGFAPSRNPEIVVAVMLVNGQVYRRKANELARDMLRTYFRAHGHAERVTDPFEDALAAADSQ